MKKLSLLDLLLFLLPLTAAGYDFTPGEGGNGTHFFDNHVAGENCGALKKRPVTGKSTFLIDMMGEDFFTENQEILDVCTAIVQRVLDNADVTDRASSVPNVSVKHCSTSLSNPFELSLLGKTKQVKALTEQHQPCKDHFVVKLIYVGDRIKTVFIEGQTQLVSYGISSLPPPPPSRKGKRRMKIVVGYL